MGYLKTTLLMAGLTALFMGIGFMIGGGNGMVIAFVLAAGMNLFSWWNSDKMVLRYYKAREVDQSTAPDLYNMVMQLAENADMPMPKVYIIENDQPNAFATGRNPENAAVAATTGLLRRLSSGEVAGVMAHELAHIKNRDTSYHDNDGIHCRGDINVGQYDVVYGWRPRQPYGYRWHISHYDTGPVCGEHRSNGHFTQSGVRGGPYWCGNLRKAGMVSRCFGQNCDEGPGD